MNDDPVRSVAVHSSIPNQEARMALGLEDGCPRLLPVDIKKSTQGEALGADKTRQ